MNRITLSLIVANVLRLFMNEAADMEMKQNNYIFCTVLYRLAKIHQCKRQLLSQKKVN